MEYSPTGSFLDGPTFDILDRDFTGPPYTTSVSNNVLTITTSQMTLTYQLGSGPFTTTNTSMKLLGALPPGASASVTPTWGLECTFGQVCQSGAAALAGGASLASDHKNSVSPAGFVAGLTAAGAAATWQVLGAPAGDRRRDPPLRQLHRRARRPGAAHDDTWSSTAPRTQVTLPPTASWDDWSTVTVPVTLAAGTNTVALDCASGDSCNVNIDDIAVTAPGASAAAAPAGQAAGRLHPLLRLDQRHVRLRHADLRERPVRRHLRRRHPGDGPGPARPVRVVPARRHPDRGVDLDGWVANRARPATSRTATCSATARTTPARCPTWPG